MSSISGISSGEASLVDLLKKAQEEQNKDSILDTSTVLDSSNRLLSNTQAKKMKSAYGGGASSSIGQAALNKALSEIGGNGKVTFKDITEHRENLEVAFSASLRVGLAENGVSIDTPFTLNMNADGQIEVECDDPVAKEKIQEYLEDNPEVCEQFGYIQALSNVERARSSSVVSQQGWQQIKNDAFELQTQAVELFFSQAQNAGMAYSSLMASFAPGTGSQGTDSAAASFYTGLNFTV